jgi:hypothetical protein
MSFLNRLLGRDADAKPTPDSITFDESRLVRHHANGRVESMRWVELGEVAVLIRPDARGLTAAHIVLTGGGANMIVGPRTRGADALVERLAQLPRFDAQGFTEAMARTDKARIAVWSKPGASAAAAAAMVAAAAAAPARAPAPPRAPARPAGDELELVPMDGEESAGEAAPAAAPRPGGGYLRLSIAPSHATVADYAGTTVRNMASVYNIQMDWSIESLVHIDRALAAWHKGGAPLEKVNKSMYSMGSYAGEVMLRHARGRWIDPSDDDEQVEDMANLFLCVELEDGRRWAPIALCIQALTDGPEHSLLRTARALLATA